MKKLLFIIKKIKLENLYYSLLALKEKLSLVS